MPEELRVDLRTLAERLLLGERQFFIGDPVLRDIEYAIDHGIDTLEARGEVLSSTLYELKLRLALHLSPIAAIHYDPLNPRPRHRLVYQYLVEKLDRPAALVNRLARDVASVLNQWDAGRSRVGTHREKLLSQQGGRCNHCGVILSPTPSSVAANDAYKPYHLDDDLLHPEVDHVESISGFGTNQIDNLQVLCRLCNLGKGDGLGVSVRDEALHAARPIGEIPVTHRARIFFYTLLRTAKGQSPPSCELTVRPIRPDGGFLRTNLAPIAAGA